MENSHSLPAHLKLEPQWLETFSEMKEEIAPRLMHDFGTDENYRLLHMDLDQNTNELDSLHHKHDDLFYQNSNRTMIFDRMCQSSVHIDSNLEEFDKILKSDTKKHRRKASAPQRALPKESTTNYVDTVEQPSELSQDGLPIDSHEFENLKNENIHKIEQILESDAIEEFRNQKVTNLERLLDSEGLSDNGLLEDPVDSVISLENGDWKKFLNEFEAQDIFKDLQEEGDGETLEGEIFSNVKEEFKAHWGVKCNMCEAVFPFKVEFDKHYIASYKLKPVYTCTFCNKSVDKYTTFRSHCYRHITEGRFKCKQCSKGFSLQSMLQVHILAKHTESKPFMCEECGRSFVTKPGLNIHLKKHKIEVKEDYPCVECGKVLHTRGGLTSHMNVHRLGRRFMCDICGKTFTQKVNMQQHVKQHTGNKPHECKKCGKSFAERSHLARHISFHSEERPYKCSVCSKMYKTERCLKVHSLVHAEARPYTCEYCKKGFLSSTKLKQHYNIHTGERPYKCKYCERTFTNYPNWLKHTRRRHKVDHRTGEGLPDQQPQTKAIPDVTDRIGVECQKDSTNAAPLLQNKNKPPISTTGEFSYNEDTLDKTHLDIETNLMLDKNLDLDGKSLVLNHKKLIFDEENEVKPLLKTIDKLVCERLIENMNLQNNLGENSLLNDINLLKSDEMHLMQDSVLMGYPIFDNAKVVIGQQLEFLSGNSSSSMNSMTYLVPYLQNALPSQALIHNAGPSSSDLVHSNSLVQQSCE